MISTPMRPNIVYVDPRVGSVEFLEPLHRRFGLRVAVAEPQLRSGDFAFRCGHVEPSPFCEGRFGCRLGIERKTISDMVGSLLKNRMGKQVPDLLDDYTLSWIVVEGLWRNGPDDCIEIYRNGQWISAGFGLTYTQLETWLTRYDVMGKGKILRWRTANPGETGAFITSKFRWWQKEWRHHHAEVVDKMQAPMRVLTWRPTQMHKTAASLPEVGVVNAKKVGKHFRNIAEMIGADLAVWQRLLGKADGATVYAAIHKDYR
jgi:hypothetical protein